MKKRLVILKEKEKKNEKKSILSHVNTIFNKQKINNKTTKKEEEE